jgi:proteic killer suppression protein
VDVSWRDRKLQSDSRSDKLGSKRWGKDEWKILKRRLVSLEAAPTMRDLHGVPGGFHALTGDRKGHFAMSVTRNRRLILEPDHDPIPTKEDGGIDEAQVSAVRVLEVVDDHG